MLPMVTVLLLAREIKTQTSSPASSWTIFSPYWLPKMISAPGLFWWTVLTFWPFLLCSVFTLVWPAHAKTLQWGVGGQKFGFYNFSVVSNCILKGRALIHKPLMVMKLIRIENKAVMKNLREHCGTTIANALGKMLQSLEMLIKHVNSEDLSGNCRECR